MQKYSNNYAGQSGQPIVGAAVLVKNLDGTAATIYSDNSKTKLTGLTTGIDGSFGFYAANGRYTVTLSKAGLKDIVIDDVLMYDPADDAANMVNVKDFGAKGDSITIDTLALRTAFAAGGDIYVPPGTYLLDNTLIWTVTRDTRIVCAAGAVFKGTANFPVDNKFLMASTDGGQHLLEWEGGKLDGRLRPARSVGAPDLFYISDSNFRRVHIDRLHFLSNDDWTGAAGDSGLFLAEGEDYWVTNCTFQGCIDAGLYVSGDNALAKGRRVKALGNTFLYCSVAIITKRLFEDHLLDENIIAFCGTGIVVGGEGSATQGAGRKAVISNNLIRHVERGIEARLADGTIISSNRIEDFGISMNGAVVADHAIVIAGSKKCTVSDNGLLMTGAFTPSSATAGINIDVRAFNGATYDSSYNMVTDNVIDGVYRGIQENGTCDYNMLLVNTITNATLRTTVVGAHTVVKDIDPVAGTSRTRFGSSGQAVPVTGATIIHEDDTDIIYNLLAPSTKSVQWIVGDEASNAIGRFGYNHASDEWTWRAGGSGVVFGVRSDGPKFGTVSALAAETITGYITIHDVSGTARKLAVIA